MAGYVVNPDGHEYLFNVGDPNLTKILHDRNQNRRIMRLQLDEDELEAALWGLEQWNKPGPQVPLHNKKGIWVAYNLEWSQAKVFLEEIDALRYAVEEGYTSVKFWEFGQDKPN